MGHRGCIQHVYLYEFIEWTSTEKVYSYRKANRIIRCQTHPNTSQTTPLFKQLYAIWSILQCINHTSILAEKLTFPFCEFLARYQL